MLDVQIAEKLELAFSQHGFAEPSVSKLQASCGVSLRTLYKYYPSKEAMIVGALNYRHQRYLSFLLDNAPSNERDAVTYIFDQLEMWMENYAPHGCLSLNALAAFPDNSSICQAVNQHKEDVRQLLGKQSGRRDLAAALYLLHEGVSNAWPVIGTESVSEAKKIIHVLLGEK
ncbi:TetR/AcrR family transcriptional regulator [Enterovibrio calviensis]|uniref:TetR/AcrR family transcriptional regulator n=1 Tax=Enterovibrio calviensis TaxID=91359 RepID=UPI000486A2E3|nr:TetR/AcrR family transcriptional regulator [Enterovibrio calviensis]